MRSVSVVLILVVVAIANAAPTPDKPHYDVSNAKALFQDFVKKYNKTYKDDADKDVHYHAFIASLELINKSNDLSTSAIFDINGFADYTLEEMKSMFGSKNTKI